MNKADRLEKAMHLEKEKQEINKTINEILHLKQKLKKCIAHQTLVPPTQTKSLMKFKAYLNRLLS